MGPSQAILGSTSNCDHLAKTPTLATGKNMDYSKACGICWWLRFGNKDFSKTQRNLLDPSPHLRCVFCFRRVVLHFFLFSGGFLLAPSPHRYCPFAKEGVVLFILIHGSSWGETEAIFFLVFLFILTRGSFLRGSPKRGSVPPAAPPAGSPAAPALPAAWPAPRSAGTSPSARSAPPPCLGRIGGSAEADWNLGSFGLGPLVERLE